MLVGAVEALSPRVRWGPHERSREVLDLDAPAAPDIAMDGGRLLSEEMRCGGLSRPEDESPGIMAEGCVVGLLADPASWSL